MDQNQQQQQPEQQRRRFQRVVVNIPAKLSVLVPEETFNPPLNEATVVDLSERGAMVTVKINELTYNSLLQRTRYCRLQFHHSLGLPDRIVGKAVWIQPEKPGDQSRLKIGLFFEDCPDAVVERLREFVEKELASKAEK